MNAAHEHAENAEAFGAKGLLIPALEEHLKAAEAYLAAVDRTSDDAAKRTLRMLHQDHLKAHQQLERKVEKLRQEGKDPALPQPKPDLLMPGSFHPAPSPAPYGPNLSSTSYRSVNDTQGTVDESFMLLGAQKSDPGDAFNHFWNIMQGMLDNLSQPVAFATAPLTVPEASSSRPTTPPFAKNIRKDGNLSSETDSDETLAARLTKRLGFSTESKAKSRIIAAPQSDDDFEEDILDDGEDLSGSFFLIPSSKEPSTKALKKENSFLKAEVESLKKRLESAERVLNIRKEQDEKLRDSIFLATKEAQRAIGSPQRPGIDFSSLQQVPVPGYNSAREAQYARKVKELQDELGMLKAELEKHRARWAKVKESARRKKEARAEATKASVRERIVEEPEVEEAEDKAQVL